MEDDLAGIFNSGSAMASYHFDYRVIDIMDEELLSALNKWRLAQPSEMDERDAILSLLRNALRDAGMLPSPQGGEGDDAYAGLVEALKDAALSQRKPSLGN